MSGKRSVIKDQSHNCSILPLAQPSPARLVVQRRNPILWEVKQMFWKTNSSPQNKNTSSKCSNLRALTPDTSLQEGTDSEVLIKKTARLVGLASQNIANLMSQPRKVRRCPLVYISFNTVHIQGTAHRQDLTQEFVTQCKHAQKCPWLLTVAHCLKIPSREAITEGESHFSSSIYSAQFTLDLATAQLWHQLL